PNTAGFESFGYSHAPVGAMRSPRCPGATPAGSEHRAPRARMAGVPPPLAAPGRTPSAGPVIASPRRPVTRFQKLAAAPVLTAILLVTIGVIVRVTGSGLGCPDWPLCNGRIIPALDDAKAWIEWVHRTVAVIIGFEVIGLAVLAFLDHRDRRVLLGATVVAVVLVGFQAWLGRETVRLGNSG